jgi:hypothetical protein
LDILFLRPDKPGNLWAGDIDNRIKTLIDALAIPTANEMYSDRAAADDEKPFYVLMENDPLLTKLSVETDRLLDCDGTNSCMDKTKLVITVRLRPYEIHAANIHFA